ncbi:hypothetical protein [Cutibacterium sp.]|uniref:hypothetical protein n=1 Tax=Cutibacterium sp. TaxID=1912221 RepID=UPI0034C6BF9E
MILLWCYGISAFPYFSVTSGIGQSAIVLHAFMMVAGPVALSACLELRRFTDGQVLAKPTGRSRLWIILPWWSLAVLPSALAVGVSVLIPASGDQVIRMAVIGIIWMLAWGVFGAVIGMSWPLALSAPTALILPFILVVYGPAVPVLELRYLFGDYTDCCNVGEMLNPRVLTAGIAMAVGILIVSVVAGIVRSFLSRSIVTLTLIIGLVASALLSFNIVKGVGPFPAVPRTGPQICLSDKAPTVCAWESHDLELFAPMIRDADTAWRSAGIQVPKEYRQGTGTSTRDTVWWSTSETTLPHLRSDTVLSVASGLAVAPCQDGNDDVDVWVLDIQERVVAWLTKHSGIAMTGLDFSPETHKWLTSMDRLSIEDQVTIVEDYRLRLRKC